MSSTVGLGWLNTNATRNYPISQEANMTPLGSAGFELPDDVIVDMRLSVPYAPKVKPFYFYLKSVSAYAHGLIVEIGYYNSVASSEKATVAISEAVVAANHTNPTTYTLTGVNTNTDYDFSNAVGVITIGNLDELLANPPGRVDFPTDSYLESTVISMNTAGVSSLRVGANVQSADPALTGHIVLRPRTNFAIRTSVLENSLGFSALKGTGLVADCTCEGEIELGPCIRKINGLPPDGTGNIGLAAGTCISVDNGENTILLSDTCSSPCCGCDQLDILVADLRDLQNGFDRLDSYITALAGAVESIRSSAFGSVVASNSCSVCD
jgi:hypothetical protein